MYDGKINYLPSYFSKRYRLVSYRYRRKNITAGLLPLLKQCRVSGGKKGNYYRIMKVVVCIGSSCHLKGSHQVVSCIKKLIEKYNLDDRIELSGTFCMGNCQNDVCVSVDGEIFSVVPEETTNFFENNILKKVLN